MDNQNQAGVDQWLRTATPEQLIATGQTVLQRVATLDQRYRDQFTREISGNNQIAKLMKHPAEAI